LSTREFSLKTRKLKEKNLALRGKFKLKTKKALQRRIRVCGGLRNKMFSYHAMGYRHLNRNKSKRNLRTKKNYKLTHLPDIKRAKKMLPYFRKRKYLRC